ncbi:glycosyltransferase family 4 protein [Aureispira anguillae]|uniref:Undecaprenyl/decaprenyl-phosphate alpha-N-acetylglucosaminyl 1-phosphate transferase n=1 Tax=Aureispira anguillae TaxID=2864201 RepID=A0A915YKB3_9BACT|nr:MraY family glycosyltransferase [Aureispira anguillae]BDS14655.1 undecaprenyl/decaprenyl-phosphate alpha-N-acetylglucosaminyl 1-phosphate transferase [Aureispira anguillae]
MYDIIPAFLTAFLITYFAIPSIIKVAVEKNLVDEPGERRSHSKSVPTLGGLGIFAGLIFSTTFWVPFHEQPSHLQYILCAFIVIFLIGAKDDIIPLSPSKKFTGQIFAAFLLVYFAKIQLTSLYGIFGIHEISDIIGIPLTVFTIIVIINAFNLIDGINALSGTIGCIICGTFGYWFYMMNQPALAILSAALAGSLIAFLRYNLTAEIFMGDTGSLLIGLTASILAISFIQANVSYVNEYSVESVPAVTIGILIIPLFDTLRVFTLRILKGHSPFSPDRTHIHHLLLDLGYTHLQATGLLGFVNLLFIVVVFELQWLGTLELGGLVILLGILFTAIVEYALRRKKRKEKHA